MLLLQSSLVDLHGRLFNFWPAEFHFVKMKENSLLSLPKTALMFGFTYFILSDNVQVNLLPLKLDSCVLKGLDKKWLLSDFCVQLEVLRFEIHGLTAVHQ